MRSFRSNLVLRWEWRLGSTLFVVWQQDRSLGSMDGRLVRPARLLDGVSASGDTFLTIKASYWFPLY